MFLLLLYLYTFVNTRLCTLYTVLFAILCLHTPLYNIHYAPHVHLTSPHIYAYTHTHIYRSSSPPATQSNSTQNYSTTSTLRCKIYTANKNNRNVLLHFFNFVSKRQGYYYVLMLLLED